MIEYRLLSKNGCRDIDVVRCTYRYIMIDCTGMLHDESVYIRHTYNSNDRGLVVDDQASCTLSPTDFTGRPFCRRLRVFPIMMGNGLHRTRSLAMDLMSVGAER